jgi:hypothetical protein
MPCGGPHKAQSEDIIREVETHSFYLKPGAKRRVKPWHESVPEKRFAKTRRGPDVKA